MKTHEFLDMKALKTFACYDVHKENQGEKYLKEYKEYIINKIKLDFIYGNKFH